MIGKGCRSGFSGEGACIIYPGLPEWKMRGERGSQEEERRGRKEKSVENHLIAFGKSKWMERYHSPSLSFPLFHPCKLQRVDRKCVHVRKRKIPSLFFISSLQVTTCRSKMCACQKWKLDNQITQSKYKWEIILRIYMIWWYACVQLSTNKEKSLPLFFLHPCFLYS